MRSLRRGVQALAEECEMGQDAIMKDCAMKCRECERSCREMVRDMKSRGTLGTKR